MVIAVRAHCNPLDIYIYIYIYIYISKDYNVPSLLFYIYIYIYTEILEVNLFAFAYRLFRRDFSPLDGTYCMGTHFKFRIWMNTFTYY